MSTLSRPESDSLNADGPGAAGHREDSVLPDFSIDLRGESCPYPVIHTLEALHGLTPGQTLRVSIDCPQAYRNVPDDAVAAGHELMGEPGREGARMTYIFRRGDTVLGTHITDDSKPGFFRRLFTRSK